MDDKYLALQLKSAEGQGLSDSDILRSTKVIHKVPCTKHQLMEFIGAFALILSTLFGPSAPIHLAVQGWVSHIRDNQMVYAQLLCANPAFGCRVLALIDRALQLYSRACLNPTRHQGAECLLLFETYQSQIIMNTFSYPVLPAAIARLIQSPNSATSSLTCTTSTQSSSSLLTRSPVFNHDHLPSLRATQETVTILQNRVNSAPLWTTCHPPCRPCAKYHSGGECTTACPCATTHHPPMDADLSSYQNWVTSSLHQSSANTNTNNSKNPTHTSPIAASPPIPTPLPQ